MRYRIENHGRVRVFLLIVASALIAGACGAPRPFGSGVEIPAAARRVIRLDPGQAFGTGTHPTTQMCLRWIARMAPTRAAEWTRVLDYGCGSGVLLARLSAHLPAAELAGIVAQVLEESSATSSVISPVAAPSRSGRCVPRLGALVPDGSPPLKTGVRKGPVWSVKIEEPIKTTYKGIEVHKLNTWTQGAALLQMLNVPFRLTSRIRS